jgi:uncharacterized protein YjbJ (UPF0337 family)
MTDEHTKGAISKVTGKVEEALGKLTGNKRQELHGSVKQVQGAGQEALGDVQDALRRPDHEDDAREGDARED